MKKYQIVYADPPWNRLKGGLRKARPHQGRQLDYSTLRLPEIKHILAQINAPVLFLWTIDKYLHEAEAMAYQLGYKLHARIIWDKENGVAPAFTIRYAHEYLLWLYRERFTPIATDMRGRFTTVLRERAARHSAKPEIAYTLIDSLYPNLAKIELFARQKREGWDCWGNEVESDIELEVVKDP